MNDNLARMVEIASTWEDIRGRGRHGCDKAEGYTMFDMLDELRDLIRATQDNDNA